MAIQLTCHCGTNNHIPDSFAGQLVACKRCGYELKAPVEPPPSVVATPQPTTDRRPPLPPSMPSTTYQPASGGGVLSLVALIVAAFACCGGAGILIYRSVGQQVGTSSTKDAVAKSGSMIGNAENGVPEKAKDMQLQIEHKEPRPKVVDNPPTPAKPVAAAPPVAVVEPRIPQWDKPKTVQIQKKTVRTVDGSDVPGFPYDFDQTDYVNAAAKSQFSEHFVSEGFQLVDSRKVDVFDAKQILTSQVATVEDDIPGNIAFAGQVLRIHGTIEGDLDVIAQSVTIEVGAVIKGDLRAHSTQAIHLKGKINGKVTGKWQALYGQENVAGEITKLDD